MGICATLNRPTLNKACLVGFLAMGALHCLSPLWSSLHPFLDLAAAAALSAHITGSGMLSTCRGMPGPLCLHPLISEHLATHNWCMANVRMRFLPDACYSHSVRLQVCPPSTWPKSDSQHLHMPASSPVLWTLPLILAPQPNLSPLSLHPQPTTHPRLWRWPGQRTALAAARGRSTPCRRCRPA